MKTWKVPVLWEVCSLLDIEADTLEQAVEIARDDGGEIPCLADNSYIDGSWRVSELGIELLRRTYNDGQEDDVQKTYMCDGANDSCLGEIDYNDVNWFTSSIGLCNICYNRMFRNAIPLDIIDYCREQCDSGNEDFVDFVVELTK